MRLAAGLCAVVTWWGCRDLTVAGPPSLVIDPVLDSLFVGDVSLRPSVIYYDGAGGSRIPAPTEIHWASSDTATLEVDSLTGRMTARRRGIALILATVQSTRGSGLVVVSNTLDLTLLLDTIYAMPGDTLTVPIAVRKLNSPPETALQTAASGRRNPRPNTTPPAPKETRANRCSEAKTDRSVGSIIRDCPR